MSYCSGQQTEKMQHRQQQQLLLLGGSALASVLSMTGRRSRLIGAGLREVAG
jgi:hypothetical protein